MRLDLHPLADRRITTLTIERIVINRSHPHPPPTTDIHTARITSIGIVYPAAALGVIYDPRTGQQCFHKGHKGDIISLTVSSCRRFAASGDAANPPRVHVWDTVTGAGDLLSDIIETPSPFST